MKRLFAPTGALDAGLLVLRVGLGAMMMFHGWPKLMGGAAMWTKLGAATAYVGISFAPTFWGFMASATEFFGGALLMVGVLSRVNAGLLFVTMAVASAMHLGKGDGIGGASHALEDGVAFLGLLLIGPGRYSVDAWLHARLHSEESS